ncbi:glycosyltransferase family 4 protein [Hyphococcus formosus]|uniref:glycosyltransferase family 4 protein n=1 Tax=Hyphococcus formosus TaxID=3143534 RepID=UPI00398BAC78
MIRFEKTVLQVIPRLDAGGAERTTLEIADAVTRSGGNAIVVTAGGRLVKNIENVGGRVFIAPVASKNPWQIWQNGKFLSALITREKVDIIHARSRAPAWSALFAARKTGIPLVSTYHGAYSEKSRIKRFYNSSMLRADRIIANSHFTAERILATDHTLSDIVRVIPRGVDIRTFDPKKVSADRVNTLANEWGVPEKVGVKLLLPARLTPWKGHEIAIEALSKLLVRLGNGNTSGQGQPLALVFCGGAQGKGDFVSQLRALIDECGVREMVYMGGDCADMPAAYAWADIVLAPSTKPEAFGRVAIEASAMEKPVIAANHGGVRETVIRGETGLLVTPDNSDALAHGIFRMMNLTPEERRSMGEKGRARATSLFSSDAMCDATIGVYRELLAERA